MAGVTSSASLGAFLAALEKSGLLSAEELAQATADSGDLRDVKIAARELVKQGRLSRWQAGQLLHGYHQLRIGNYRLVDQLGSGELGRVYLAEHGQLNRRVALKVLSRRHMSDPKILQGFLADARRAGGLDHRNICHVYDVTQEGDRCCVVMEYVEGSNLQTLAKAGPQPLGRVLEMARQIAEGLGHAHENGVVHGDLTPSNLLLDKHGCIKIVDMGVSRLTDNAPAPRSDESGEGPNLTAGIYRSPEQISGNAATSASDWFALGGVLCHLLTSSPFHSNEAADFVQSLKSKRADLSPAILDLLTSLTASVPAVRPKSAAEVTTALDAAAASALAQPAIVAPTHKLPPVIKGKPTTAGGQTVPKSESQVNKPPRRPPVARSLDEPAPAVAESGGFTLEGLTNQGSDTGAFSFSAVETSGPKKPPLKATTAPNKALPKSATKPASAKDSTKTSFKPSKPLIIGGAIGAVVFALAGIVVLVVVLTRGNDEKSVASLASKTPVKKTASADAEKDSTASKETSADKAPSLLAANEPVAAAESPATIAAAAPMTPPPAVAEPPTAGAAATTATAATPEAPLAKADPDTMKPMAPETPAPAPVAEPGPQSLADVVAAEAVPAPTEASAAPVAPNPAPAAPEALGNPFAALPKLVKLAELPSTAGGELTPEALAPVTIGSLKLPADAIVAVDLSGAESAFKGGKQTYSIEAANGGTAQRDWEISCGGETTQPAVIALLSAKDDQLTFQWTPEAGKNSAAGNLCNCLVEMRVGPVSHAIALRQPIVGEPLGLELDKAGQPARWLIPYLPDPQSIELEIASFETPAPKSKLESKSLTASQPTTQALLGMKEEEFPLGFDLTFAVQAKGLQLSAAPKIKIQGIPAGKDKYNKKAVQNLIALAAAAQQNGDVGLTLVDQQFKEAGDRKKAKERYEEMKVSGAKASEQLADLQTLAESAKSGRVHVRAWYLTGGGKVLLLDTGGPPPAAAP